MQLKLKNLSNVDLQTLGNNGYGLLQKEYLVDKSYNFILEKI